MKFRLLVIALVLAGCTARPRAHLTVAGAVGALEGAPISGLAQLPTGLLTGAGAGLLSDHGAGILADNGASVVANNGGQLVGKAKFGLLATGQKPAIAFQVQVVDAAGAPVLDPAGKPYAATTGEDGRFSIARRPMGHNLLLKLALPGDVGALLALLPPDGREVALEGVGTHVVGYVLDQFVAGKQEALDRPLQGAVDEAIARAEEALSAVAGGKLEVKSLSTSSVVATVGVWRDLSKDFDAQLRTVQQVVN